MSGKIRLYSGTVAIEARGFVKSGIDIHTVVILVIGKLKQEDQEFRAISWRGGWLSGKDHLLHKHEDTCSNTQNVCKNKRSGLVACHFCNS